MALILTLESFKKWSTSTPEDLFDQYGWCPGSKSSGIFTLFKNLSQQKVRKFVDHISVNICIEQLCGSFKVLYILCIVW